MQINSTFCQFACIGKSFFSVYEALLFLSEQFHTNNFLNETIQAIYGSGIIVYVSNIQKKRDSNFIQFSLPNCTNSTQDNDVLNTISGLISDVIPNVSTSFEKQQCSLEAFASDADLTKPLPIAVIVSVSVSVVVVIILVTASIFLLREYMNSELHKLPKEISWSFLNKLYQPWKWDYFGSKSSGYYVRKYEKNSEEWKNVSNLLNSLFNGSKLTPIEISAVYNKTLATSFVNNYAISVSRKLYSSEHFFSVDYRKNNDKLWIMEKFQTFADLCPWNKDLTLPIIPSLHGTDYFVARAIAETGFAALSSLDAGYFGKGIYFTTCMLYTLPYSCLKRNPAVVISYLNMGNIFPITESHKGPKSFVGSALKSGYNSHYVITNKDGSVYDRSTQNEINLCDEIVIGQESQILPAFIVSLDLTECKLEYSNWERTTPTTAEEIMHGVIENNNSNNSNNNKNNFSVYYDQSNALVGLESSHESHFSKLDIV